MITLISDPKKSTATELLQSLSAGLDEQKMDDFLDHLLTLARELGSITCTLVDDSSLSLRSGNRLLDEAQIARAGAKLRMLCARLAVRCRDWSGQDVSPYGAAIEFESPLTKKPCRTSFENTTTTVKLAFEDCTTVRRNRLIEQCYKEVQKEARVLLRIRFPSYQNSHDSASIVNQAFDRILSSAKDVPLESERDFRAIVKWRMLHVLIDIARREGHRPDAGIGGSAARFEPSDKSNNPVDLTHWTEFQDFVEKLPEDERAVFKLVWYEGRTQDEAAKELGIHPRKASRLYGKAWGKLPDPRA